MKSYFKFIGYLFLLFWFIGLIAFILNFAQIAAGTTYEIAGKKYTAGGLTTEGYFYYFMMLILYIIAGPAIGLLCISHGSQLEKNTVVEKLVEHDEVMQDEIKKTEEKKREEGIYESKNYKIDDGLITINGRLHRIKELTNIRVEGNNVCFSFLSLNYKIECKSLEEANTVYNQLKNNQ